MLRYRGSCQWALHLAGLPFSGLLDAIDKNTVTGGEPVPGPVTDEAGLEPVQLIAMSDAVSRMSALMLGSGTGSFRALLDKVEQKGALYGTRLLVLAAAVACAAFAFLNSGRRLAP